MSTGPLRLIASLSDVTTLRKADIRLLLLTQVGEDWIRVTPSKTRRRTGDPKPPYASLDYGQRPN